MQATPICIKEITFKKKWREVPSYTTDKQAKDIPCASSNSHSSSCNESLKGWCIDYYSVAVIKYPDISKLRRKCLCRLTWDTVHHAGKAWLHTGRAGWSHRICTWKAESEQEVKLGYKALRPTYCDLLPSMRLHPLLVLYSSQTVPSATCQVRGISYSNPWQMVY